MLQHLNGIIGQTDFPNLLSSCHSAQSTERFGAPPGINFDSQEDVELFADLIYESHP